jgi:hypothetical protein
MLARIQNEQTIDIYNYVRYLRTRRMFMVQTEVNTTEHHVLENQKYYSWILLAYFQIFTTEFIRQRPNNCRKKEFIPARRPWPFRIFCSNLVTSSYSPLLLKFSRIWTRSRLEIKTLLGSHCQPQVQAIILSGNSRSVYPRFPTEFGVGGVLKVVCGSMVVEVSST